MTKKPVPSNLTCTDTSEDTPAWTSEQLARAELAEAGQVLREARGTLSRPRGRPKKSEPKELIRIRLSAEVMRYFRATGKGWQTRIDEALRGLLPPAS